MERRNDGGVNMYLGLVGLLLISAALVGMCSMHADAADEPPLPDLIVEPEVQAPAPIEAPEPFVKPPSDPAPLHVLLARILVSESGWRTINGSNANEPEMIALVLVRRARLNDWTLREAMERYSPRATGVRKVRTQRRWVQGMGATSGPPAGWPDGLYWYPWTDDEGRARTGYIARWKVRLVQARALVQIPVDDPRWDAIAEETCAGWPDHWGGAMDDHRAEAEGWVRILCGRTHNHAWVVPRLVRRGWLIDRQI